MSTRHKLRSYREFEPNLSLTLPPSLHLIYIHLLLTLVAVSLNKVLEVRRGQLTERFDQFPYEEVEEQSFSLMFEQVRGSPDSVM